MRSAMTTTTTTATATATRNNSLPESLRLLEEQARSGLTESNRRAVQDRSERDVKNAYARSALERECQAVASESAGNRNNRLNQGAHSLGQLVAAGALTESEVVAGLLQAAAACGLPEDEAAKTIRSGLEAGKTKPRDLSGVGQQQQQQAGYASTSKRQEAELARALVDAVRAEFPSELVAYMDALNPRDWALRETATVAFRLPGGRYPIEALFRRQVGEPLWRRDGWSGRVTQDGTPGQAALFRIVRAGLCDRYAISLGTALVLSDPEYQPDEWPQSW